MIVAPIIKKFLVLPYILIALTALPTDTAISSRNFL